MGPGAHSPNDGDPRAENRFFHQVPLEYAYRGPEHEYEHEHDGPDEFRAQV